MRLLLKILAWMGLDNWWRETVRLLIEVIVAAVEKGSPESVTGPEKKAAIMATVGELAPRILERFGAPKWASSEALMAWVAATIDTTVQGFNNNYWPGEPALPLRPPVRLPDDGL